MLHFWQTKNLICITDGFSAFDQMQQFSTQTRNFVRLRVSINDPKFVFLRSKTAAENFNASLFAQHNSHGQPVVGSLVGLYHSLSRISNLINPVFAHHPQGCRVKQIEGG